MNEHEIVIRHKVGSETGAHLQAAACSCGWKSGIWYAGVIHVSESYARHLDALATGSAAPWMVAPEVQP